MDNATDQKIQYTIKHEFKDCTVLTIAHRLETIIDSDLILVLDHGVVVEYGTPQQLLNTNPVDTTTNVVSSDVNDCNSYDDLTSAGAANTDDSINQFINQGIFKGMINKLHK